MKPDGTDSFSTASENILSPEGNRISEPDKLTGPAMKKYPEVECTSWSYVFVHNRKVKAYEDQFAKDGKTFFVHKTMRYFKRAGRQGVQHQEMPTISGLIFFQGDAVETQNYLTQRFPYVYLCKNCSTGRVALIPDSQMQPFMRISETSPERIRFLLHPFHYYARNRILLRITSGELAGLEGYVIRIDRDRRLVMDVGGISVAVAGVHAEKFEEVEPYRDKLKYEHIFYQRNLHERQALIDRYFHPVKDTSDVKAQADNIEYLRQYVLTEMAADRMLLYEAWSIFAFVIEEIGYYYAPFVDQFKSQLNPIMQQGHQVLLEMEHLMATPRLDSNTRWRYENVYQELLTKYEYLFEEC